MQPRLLFLSPLLAMPSQHGGCVYPHAILSELAKQGVAIDYAWTGAPLTNGRRWMRDPLNASYVSTSWVRGTRKLGSMLVPASTAGWLGKAETLPYTPSEYGGEHAATPAEQAFVKDVVTRLRPRAMLVDSTLLLTALDTLPPALRAQTHVAVLTHNLNSRRTDLYRAAGQPLDFLPMTRAEETALLARADTLVAIQEREAGDFREMLPAKKVVTVPMPFTPKPQPPSAEIPGRCLFVGGFSGHNIEAVKWLLADVWPLVSAECPEAELIIVGTVSRAVKDAPKSVRVLGPVDNLNDEYARASLCLVPLPLGTGLKIKLVEAMSYGRPVVTTPAGAEGFSEIENGQTVVVAESAHAYARATISLLRSPAQRQQVTTRQLAWVTTNLAPATVVHPLATLA